MNSGPSPSGARNGTSNSASPSLNWAISSAVRPAIGISDALTTTLGSASGAGSTPALSQALARISSSHGRVGYTADIEKRFHFQVKRQHPEQTARKHGLHAVFMTPRGALPSPQED